MGRDERRMIARSLRAISGRLSARTVRLVYLRGWSIAMVAARHRCTTSAAKVRLCRGRAAFREALAKLAPESVPGRRAQTRKPDQKPPRELIGSVTLGRLGSYIFRLYYAGQVTLRKIERAFRKRLGVHKRSVVGALRRARAAVLELLEENGQLVQYLVRRARERLGLDTAISRKCVLRQFALEMGEVRPLGWA